MPRGGLEGLLRSPIRWHFKMSKASKSRPCPALGRPISPADCGEQRQSRLACPESCPHNPFAPANYSQLLEIEDRLDSKTMRRLMAMAPDRDSLRREIDNAERKGVFGLHAFLVWNLFLATGPDQTTFAGRWEQSGMADLKNDERVLLRAKMRMRIALLEIHRVLDDERIEAVDLLSPNPAPMILLDRNTARSAVRFATLLTWIYPLPHFWRPSGAALTILDVSEFSAPEIVIEIVRHLGGPSTEPEIRLWLAEHFLKFEASQFAVAHLRRRQMFAGMDAKFGKAIYELRAPFVQCREWLDALPEVKHDDLSEPEESEGFASARVWFDVPANFKQPDIPGSQVVLGRICSGNRTGGWKLLAPRNSPACGGNSNIISATVSVFPVSAWMIWPSD